jgi:hypothetical protein
MAVGEGQPNADVSYNKFKGDWLGWFGDVSVMVRGDTNHGVKKTPVG